MASTDTIREFLVKLGFKVDEDGLKKFTTGIGTATKATLALGLAVEGLAVSIAYGVSRFAEDLEQLYFASQRTKASAENIRALDVAAQSFGTTAGEAKASLESLAHFLRVNPTGEAVIQMFGVKTRDSHGNLRDTSDMMVELGAQFQRMPVWQALQRGNMLGLSENTTLALRNPHFAEEYQKLQGFLKNSGFTQATADANLFMERLRTLGIFVEAFGVKVFDALAVKFGLSMDKVVAWLKNPVNAQRTAETLEKIVTWALKLGDAFVTLVDWLVRMDKQTDGLSTKLLGLLVILRYFGGAEILSGLYTLGTAMTAAFGPLVAAAAAGVALGYFFDKYLPNNPLAGIGRAISRQLSGQQQGGVGNLVDIAGGFGLDRSHAVALIANAQAESGLNPTQVGDGTQAFGLFQLHPDRQANYDAWAKQNGKPLLHEGASATDQIQFAIWEGRYGKEQAGWAKFMGARSAEEAASAYSLNVLRPGKTPEAKATDAADRAARAVTIQQDIDIHIDGAQDPVKIGKVLDGHMRNLTRDAASMVA